MSVKHKPTVDTYVQNHAKAIAAIENLLEFVQSMPAPDENGNLPTLDYGYTGSVSLLVQHLSEAARVADEMTK